MNIIGFTGTRKGMTLKQKEKFLEITKNIDIKEFHHGDCIGSDKDAHYIIRSINTLIYKIHNKKIIIICHPPKYNKYRAHLNADIVLKPKDYLDRNKDIVNISNILIATPHNKEQLRSGTWSTIRYARISHKDIFIIYPDGKIREEKLTEINK
jgi:hypothetical protein